MMSFNWTEEATKEGGRNAPKMSEDTHHVEIVEIIFSKKNQPPFKSKKSGAPQIMIVFANDADEEASTMFTLSKDAGWTLARLLSCFGLDTDAMNDEGVGPQHFADPSFANEVLIGCKGLIEVKNISGTNYQDIKPVHGVQDSDPLPKEETYIPPDDSDVPTDDCPIDSPP